MRRHTFILVLILLLVILFLVGTGQTCARSRINYPKCIVCGFEEDHPHPDSAAHRARCKCCQLGQDCVYPAVQ